MKAISHIFSDMRGSVAGITYSKGTYPGVVGRQKVAPVNPNTTFQSVGRSAFSGANALWHALSPSDKAAWQVYADSVVYTGALGEYTLSGRLSFIASMQFALNENTRLGNIADVDPDPPVIAGRLNLSGIGVVAFTPVSSTGVSFGVTNDSGEDVLVVSYLSRLFSDSRNTFKGPFISSTMKSDQVVDGVSAVVDFDGLVEDGIYFIQLRAITDSAPHRISAEFFLRAIAVTNGP